MSFHFFHDCILVILKDICRCHVTIWALLWVLPYCLIILFSLLKHRITWIDDQRLNPKALLLCRDVMEGVKKRIWEGWLLGRGCQADLTLQRDWVRWWGEFKSLGVDERSPSAAVVSENTEGWHEWHGLIRNAAVRNIQIKLCRVFRI